MKTSQSKTNRKKKILSILLALTMIFQISIPAIFAEGEENQKKIIAFENLADDVKNIIVEVDSTEAEAVAQMPNALKATYQETTTSSAIEITIENVDWERDEENSDSDFFDSSQSGAIYIYKAKPPTTDSLGDELVIESGVLLPSITVLIGAMPMLLGGGLDAASITEQGGNVTNYPTIEEAITAAKGMENCTITLLKDSTAANELEINTGTFAIDLNGKTLTCKKIDVLSGAKLTMNDSSGNNSGKLLGAIFTKGELHISSGTYQDNNPAGVYNIDGEIVKRAATIFADNGSSGIISGGIFKNNPNHNANLCQAMGMNNNAALKLMGGYFDSVSGLRTNTFAKLPIGYKLVTDGVTLNYPGGYTGAYSNVTVEKCEAHNFGDNERHCIYCRSENPDYGAPVWVTINDITTKYEANANDVKIAFDQANGNDAIISFRKSSDIALLRLTSGTITIDLNGNTLRGINNLEAAMIIDGADVILKNGTIGNVMSNSCIQIKSGSLIIENNVTFGKSSVINGSINLVGGTLEINGAKFEDEYSIEQKGGSLIVNDAIFDGLVYIRDGNTILNGGSYASKQSFDGNEYDGLSIDNSNNKTIADIIPDEAVAKTSDGTFLKKSDLTSTKSISDIKILGAPIKIVAQPQKPEDVIYGYTESRILSVSAEKTETAPPESELSYKWFLKNGVNATQVGTESSYVIPMGLDSREYNYYCEISCGNYKVNSQIVKFTVKGIAPRIEIIENFSEGIKHNGMAIFRVRVYDMDDKELIRGKVELKKNGEIIPDSFSYYGGDFLGITYYPLRYYKVPVGLHDNLVINYIPDKNYEVNYVETEILVPAFTVSKGDQEELIITEIKGKKYKDEPFVLETSGGSGVGEVSYSISSNDVLSISGNTATIIGAGTVIVTATKAEDENYLSASAQRIITIDKAFAPTLTFPTARGITYGKKLLDSILEGGSVSLGSFSWRESEKDLVPTVNGGINTARVIFTPNTTTVTNYEEIPLVDREYDVIFSVNKAQPSVNLSTRSTGASGNRNTEITINLSKSGFGEYPQGTVKLVDCTEAIEKDIAGAENISLLNGEASYIWTGLSDKAYKVKAIYDGDENYLSAISSVWDFDTTKNEQYNFELSSIASKTYGDNAFTLTTSGGTGTGAVSYTSSDERIISISGDIATIHKAGTVNITAIKAGDDNYNPAMHTLAVNVAKKALNIKADDKLNVVKGSVMPNLNYTVNGLVGLDSLTKEPVITTSAIDTNAVGEYVISISAAEVSNSESYEISYTNGKLAVINSDSGNNGSSGDSGNNSGNASSGGGASSERADTSNNVNSNVNNNNYTEIKAKVSLDKLISENTDELKISNEFVALNLDNAVLETIKNQVGADVDISVQKVDTSTLSPDARALIGNRPVFEFSITGANGQKVTDFGEGKIKITIPYTVQSDEDAQNLAVYYINDKGELEEMEGSYYDEETKTIIFETNHFSKYAIGYKESKASNTNLVVDVRFKDIENHWAKLDIEFVTKRGLFSGTGNDTFSPNMQITRGMFVTVLGKLAKADLNGFTTSSFEDVKLDTYYLPYVQWAKASGIVSGVSSSEFAPHTPMSREQMAVMLLNYMQSMGIDPLKVNEENIFSDVDEMSNWSVEAIKAMQMSGIISGKPNNKFDPKGIATRAEVSSVLRRFIELMEKE